MIDPRRIKLRLPEAPPGSIIVIAEYTTKVGDGFTREFKAEAKAPTYREARDQALAELERLVLDGTKVAPR